MIHLYTPGIGQWSICIPMKSIRKPGVFWCFQGVHERNIGLNWVKQLWNILIQLQGEHLLWHLQKRISISRKEQDLQLVILLRNEFLQRSISRTFAKKSFLKETLPNGSLPYSPDKLHTLFKGALHPKMDLRACVLSLP